MPLPNLATQTGFTGGADANIARIAQNIGSISGLYGNNAALGPQASGYTGGIDPRTGQPKIGGPTYNPELLGGLGQLAGGSSAVGGALTAGAGLAGLGNTTMPDYSGFYDFGSLGNLPVGVTDAAYGLLNRATLGPVQPTRLPAEIAFSREAAQATGLGGLSGEQLNAETADTLARQRSLAEYIANHGESRTQSAAAATQGLLGSQRTTGEQQAETLAAALAQGAGGLRSDQERAVASAEALRGSAGQLSPQQQQALALSGGLASGAGQVRPELEQALALRQSQLGGYTPAEITGLTEAGQRGIDESTASLMRQARQGNISSGRRGAVESAALPQIAEQNARLNAQLQQDIGLKNIAEQQRRLGSFENLAGNINQQQFGQQLGAQQQLGALAGATAQQQFGEKLGAQQVFGGQAAQAGQQQFGQQLGAQGQYGQLANALGQDVFNRRLGSAGQLGQLGQQIFGQRAQTEAQLANLAAQQQAQRFGQAQQAIGNFASLGQAQQTLDLQALQNAQAFQQDLEGDIFSRLAFNLGQTEKEKAGQLGILFGSGAFGAGQEAQQQAYNIAQEQIDVARAAIEAGLPPPSLAGVPSLPGFGDVGDVAGATGSVNNSWVGTKTPGQTYDLRTPGQVGQYFG